MFKIKKLLNFTCLMAAVMAFSASAFADDLDNAFNKLVSGREYIKNFYKYPEDTTTTEIINNFLGKNSGKHHRFDLLSAVLQAVDIRQNNEEGSDTSTYAQTIAWEALESLLTGYIYAGNNDLLNAIRTLYPDTTLMETDKRTMPYEEYQSYEEGYYEHVFPLDSQKKITYARLYFLQGIKDVLNYISEDSTGKVRATTEDYSGLPHYVKFDNESKAAQWRLPHDRFDDPNFGDDDLDDGQAGQTVGYLYGTALNRYGMAVTAYAEQLWKAADGVESHLSLAKKNEMLDYAADILKDNMHSQFLAVLPLAAQFSDGDGEFQKTNLPQVRASVTDALNLHSKIVKRERPLATMEVSGWSAKDINAQIKKFETAYTAARKKYIEEGVSYWATKVEEAKVYQANDQREIRSVYINQLKSITGIDPNDYERLQTAKSRTNYLEAIQNKYNELFTTGISDVAIDKSSSMYIAALQCRKAAQNVEAQQALVDSYVQRVRVELEKNDELNTQVTINGTTRSALDMAILVAQLAVSTNTTTVLCGFFSGVMNTQPDIPSKLAIAVGIAAQKGKTILDAVEKCQLNSINSAATVKNLLIEQSVAAKQMLALETEVLIKAAELLKYLDQAKQLVDDYVFHQDTVRELWYYDPTLTGKLKKVEEEYSTLVQNARVELYKLTRMMEYAWCENFSNPVKDANGSIIGNTLDQGKYDDFTEASSIFRCANYEEVLHFYNALKVWDSMLRDEKFRGNADRRNVGVVEGGGTISLRKDIFKYVDYQYDEEANQYVTDPKKRRQSIQKFQAYLQSLADKDPVNIKAREIERLRIEFPFVYGQSVPVNGVINNKTNCTIVLVSRNDQHWNDIKYDANWNQRVVKMGIKIVGRNVYANYNSIQVDLKLFGNVVRIGHAITSNYTGERDKLYFNIPLYQDKDGLFKLFGGTFDAALGTSEISDVDVPEWPLFCDNVILDLKQGNNHSLKIDNIEDIEFKLMMDVGCPSPFEFNILN